MEKETNPELERIFMEYSEGDGKLANIVNRGYVLSDMTIAPSNEGESVKNPDVLFIGLNPSYGNDGGQKYAFNPHEAGHRYFDSFKDLVKKVNVKNKTQVTWTHLDLLQMRETSQKVVMKYIDHGLDFIVDQLKFSLNQMESLRPKLIVVCNTGAARFTGVEKEDINGTEHNIWLGYDFEFDDSLGVYEIQENFHTESIGDNEQSNLDGTKVIFTSHLTYMSRYTTDTLAWQMRRVLESKNQNN